jgi:outer membrane protein assembly factor BamB
MRRILFLLAVMALAAAPAFGWDHWGGDGGGQRFSPLAQITPANVGNLVRTFEYRSGDLEARAPAVMARTKSEATPLLVEDSLIFCSPFNEAIALDPGTGAQKWRYDPGISTDQRPANRYVCRGVAYWVDGQAAEGAPCRARIFMGTNDVRVIALDARTGVPCADFGVGGEIKLDVGKKLLWPGEFQITSAPVVSRGVVIVGSSISDNARVDAPPGTVRAFDARTGAPRWSFGPLIHDGIVAGQANVWAPMSTDEDRGLVFLPTTSPSPDFFGGARPGNNEHANSVVALRAETGELVWSFQTVHHDVWDYDLPAQPTLARIDTGAGMRDVVIQPTKQGFVFVLDRDTGTPVWPVEERAVPQGAAEGEQLSPTQPFPTHVPELMPQQFAANDVFKLFPAFRRSACETQIEGLRNEGLYTPPSTQGTLEFPFTGGGVNWGGAAFDPVNQILYANTSYAVHVHQTRAARRGRRFQAAARRGTRAAARRAVCDDARGCDVAARPALQQAALGSDGRGRSEGRQDSLALDRRHIRGSRAARNRLQLGYAAGQRRGGDGRRPGLHRRDGRLSARLRCEVRRRTVAGPAAGARHRQSHDLSLEGRAICRDHGRRPFRIRHFDRRQSGGVSPGAAGRSAHAVVAHHRPARRQIHGQGDRFCAGDAADYSRGMALAPPRKVAPLKHDGVELKRSAVTYSLGTKSRKQPHAK